jgi:RNA polymerase sigma factor (sigma-70 family)
MLDSRPEHNVDWNLKDLDARVATEPLPPPAELLILLAPYCRRLIRRYGSTPELRQDLAGEIYCILHDLLEAYDISRGVPLSAYLFTQLRTTLFTRARREWRVQSREVCTSPLEEEWWEMQAVVQDTVPDRVVLRDTLLQALHELPERQRAVVYLRYFHEQEFEEIAAGMGIKKATARSLLRNGLDRLRKMMRADLRLRATSTRRPREAGYIEPKSTAAVADD